MVKRKFCDTLQKNQYLLHQAASEGNYPAFLFLLHHGFVDDINLIDDQGKTPLDKVSEGYEELLSNEYACTHSFDAIERFHIKTCLNTIKKSLKKCKNDKDKENLIHKAEIEVYTIIARSKGLLDQ